ncbi:hypothetical protein HDU83_004066 [Entophlyctis luteolus]|nr:hypothetical protein HDU83_004066 [Entophlyctis luteolus]
MQNSRLAARRRSFIALTHVRANPRIESVDDDNAEELRHNRGASFSSIYSVEDIQSPAVVEDATLLEAETAFPADHKTGLLGLEPQAGVNGTYDLMLRQLEAFTIQIQTDLTPESANLPREASSTVITSSSSRESPVSPSCAITPPPLLLNDDPTLSQSALSSSESIARSSKSSSNDSSIFLPSVMRQQAKPAPPQKVTFRVEEQQREDDDRITSIKTAPATSRLASSLQSSKSTSTPMRRVMPDEMARQGRSVSTGGSLFTTSVTIPAQSRRRPLSSVLSVSSSAVTAATTTVPSLSSVSADGLETDADGSRRRAKGIRMKLKKMFGSRDAMRERASQSDAEGLSRARRDDGSGGGHLSGMLSECDDSGAGKRTDFGQRLFRKKKAKKAAVENTGA